MYLQGVYHLMSELRGNASDMIQYQKPLKWQHSSSSLQISSFAGQISIKFFILNNLEVEVRDKYFQMF